MKRQQERNTTACNWLGKYTNSEISTIQKEDPDLLILHKWLDHGHKPYRDAAASLSPAVRRYWLNWENIVRHNGVIYHKWLKNSTDQHHLQLLVPAILKKEVLFSCHDTVYSGHLGVQKTKDRIKQEFTWYLLDKDVRMHIKTCPVCNKKKDPTKKQTTPLMDYRSGYPLDRIGLDIIGPLPQTKRRNKYLLVVGDCFTCWMEAYHIPQQNAEMIADKLVNEFISRFGVPLEVHTDQGRHFDGKFFAEICKLLETTKTRTTAYHPTSNGMIERFNRTLGSMIKSFVTGISM